MANRKVILDASVVVAALVQEVLSYRGHAFDVSKRARPILEAIEVNRVSAFAPSLAFHEVLATLHRKVGNRDAPVGPTDDLDRAAERFLSVPIRYMPVTQIAHEVWPMVRRRGISVADAWYIAAAREIGTHVELWYTHEHHDGIVQAALSEGVETRLLTEDQFQDHG